MDAEEAEQLQLLALEDFKHALATVGTQEATDTLQSYLAELHGAPEELLLQLAAAFQQAAAAALAAAGSRGSERWQEVLRLQQLLLKVVASSRQAVQQVQGVWQDAAAALLYGREGESAVAAVRRLDSCGSMLATLLGDPAHLERLPEPASHQHRRSMLACLLYLQLSPAPGVPPEVAHQLAGRAAPPWFGRDRQHAQQQMAAAFEAFAAVMQCRAVRQHLDTSTNPRTGPAAALHFLLLFRPPLPAVTDLWWAHFTAVLHAIVDEAQHSGLQVLKSPSLQPLLRSLCCQETSHMLVQLVLAHPAYQADSSGGSSGNNGDLGAAAGCGGNIKRKGGKGGSSNKGAVKQVLALAAALLEHDVPAFLAGCCELLRPEASYPLQTRVEALAAMGRAADKFLEALRQQGSGTDSDSDSDEEGRMSEAGSEEEVPGNKQTRSAATASARCRLWPPAALDQLLFVLRSDPSIRVRREAMALLSSVAVEVGSAQEAKLLHAVCQRCRDKDDAVRQDAFAMLAQFPQPSLEQHLSLADWQTLLDTGLAGPLAGSSSGSKAATAAGRHLAAIQSSARQLLLRYLEAGMDSREQQLPAGGQAAPDDDCWDQEMADAGYLEQQAGVADGGGGGGGGNTTGSRWLERLQALLPPPHCADATSGSAVAQHLHNGWQKAMQQVLEPEQVQEATEAGLVDTAADSDDGQQL